MKGRYFDQETIEKIKYLRAHGYSLTEISTALGVSQTTALRHARGVDIPPKYKELLITKRGGSVARKVKKEEIALQEAVKLVGTLTNKEKLLFLSALYWAEGSKKDLGLSNTDPNMIKVYINGLKEVFGVDKDRLSVSIRVYEDLNKDYCLSFWSNITGVPKDKFISVNVLPGKKKGKLPYGMCRVRVKKGGDILKKIAAVNKVVFQTLPL